MSLARFSIIVAVDSAGGIGKNGDLPWDSRSDRQFFRDTTIGQGRNAVIMGRVTYESLPEQSRPLQSRHNIIVSREYKQENHPEVSVCESVFEALKLAGSSSNKYDNVFIAGGEQIYTEVVKRYLYLCDKIIITKFKVS